MPNIVYVLTNPAMPGIVKIGMTDKLEVQPRMRDLYTTGVPLPFDCVIAIEVVSPVSQSCAHLSDALSSRRQAGAGPRRTEVTVDLR